MTVSPAALRNRPDYVLSCFSWSRDLVSCWIYRIALKSQHNNRRSANKLEFLLLSMAGPLCKSSKDWQRCCLILVFLPLRADSSGKKDVRGQRYDRVGDRHSVHTLDKTQKFHSFLAGISFRKQREPEDRRCLTLSSSSFFTLQINLYVPGKAGYSFRQGRLRGKTPLHF